MVILVTPEAMCWFAPRVRRAEEQAASFGAYSARIKQAFQSFGDHRLDAPARVELVRP
jgi:hypothetical protein